MQERTLEKVKHYLSLLRMGRINLGMLRLCGFTIVVQEYGWTDNFPEISHFLTILEYFFSQFLLFINFDFIVLLWHWRKLI